MQTAHNHFGKTLAGKALALKTNLFWMMICCLALVSFHPQAWAQQSALKIAAVVNEDAVSATDVQERMKLIIVSSGLPDSREIRQKIQPQVVESLIEEQLKLQEAKRYKLTVSEEEVEEGFKMIADQNKFNIDQFLDIMKKQGVPKTTLSNQIRAQLAWNKVIKERLRPRVDVTESDVDTRLERIKASLGKTEYLVSEIYLPVDNAKRAREVQQLATKISGELQTKKIPFGAVAAQFSKAAGAEKGGSLGWIQQGQLESDMDKFVLSLAEGQVSDPINTKDGIHILFLQKKRTLTEESVPSRDALKNQIGFERLDRLQQRTLSDLKAAAFIDRRV